MVKYCCVKNCKSFWHPRTKISFYSFPLKDEELLQKWISTVPVKHKSTKHKYVCSEHFVKTDYEQRGMNIYVKKTAVPSRFDINDDIQIDSDNESEGKCQTEINVKSSPRNQQILQEVKVLQNKEICKKERTGDEDIIDVCNNAMDFCEVTSINTMEPHTSVAERKLLPSEKEDKMRRKIKLLQDRLWRRERKLKNIESLIKVLKQKGNCKKGSRS